MADPENIITAHYETARTEIMERFRQRDRYLVLFLTAATAIFGVYAKYDDLWPALLAIPILAGVAGAMYAQTDVSLKAISLWLRDEYTAMLEDYSRSAAIDFPLRHWDNSDVERGRLRAFSSDTRYYGVGLTLVVCSIGASGLAWVKAGAVSNVWAARSIILFLFAVSLVGAAALLLARAHRMTVAGSVPKSERHSDGAQRDAAKRPGTDQSQPQ